jgi:hypothetical protein
MDMCSLTTENPELFHLLVYVNIFLIGGCLLAFILYFTAVNTKSDEISVVLVHLHFALISASLFAFIIYLILPRGTRRFFFNSDRRLHVHSAWQHHKYRKAKSTLDLRRMQNISILDAQTYLVIASPPDDDLLSPMGESTTGTSYEDIFRRANDNRSTTIYLSAGAESLLSATCPKN